MKLLVLGGTHHVGRSVVEAALAGGHLVTTFTRGESGPPALGAEGLFGDRTDPTGLRDRLAGRTWDAVVDTWSGAPVQVHKAAQLLQGRVGFYAYVSSRSVYRWPIPIGVDETAPVVDADPSSPDEDDYAAAKRGGELAVQEVFGDASLCARAGLILGPYERVGRLPWWLRRIERGGRVLAPGPADLPLQYIDGRDLAEWMVSMAEAGSGGVFNTVSQPGHTTMGALLDACLQATASTAELVWIPPETVLDAGVEPWTQLPIWMPVGSEGMGLHTGDVRAAERAGLRCRPVRDTVSDTWAWLQDEGDPPLRPGREVGLDPVKEASVLASI